MTAIALDTKSAFLEALAKTGKVKQACAEADCSRQSAYRWRDSDIEFATAWDRALECRGCGGRRG